MVPQKSGVILNISSVHERIPWSGFSAYTASKAALAMLTQTLSLEAAPHGVRIMALAPGAVKTPINREVWQDDQNRAELLQKIPLDRVGEPEEIARTALFLASPAASYLTGSTVFADGGMIDYPDFASGG
jgi:NAD(P)-dependent dehydrogenase (short-subunit alcohol dehydrogenase family)